MVLCVYDRILSKWSNTPLAPFCTKNTCKCVATFLLFSEMLHCVCVCLCVCAFLHACTCRALFEHISAIMKKCLDTLEKQAMIRLDQLIKMVGKVSDIWL